MGHEPLFWRQDGVEGSKSPRARAYRDYSRAINSVAPRGAAAEAPRGEVAADMYGRDRQENTGRCSRSGDRAQCRRRSRWSTVRDLHIRSPLEEPHRWLMFRVLASSETEA